MEDKNTRKMICKTMLCNWGIPCEIKIESDHVDPTTCLLGNEKVEWEMVG